MMLIDQIKGLQLRYRKAGEKVAAQVLTTLIGEAENQCKRQGFDKLPDDLTIALLKRFHEGIVESIKRYGGDKSHADAIDALEIEKRVVEDFIPLQLTEDDLHIIISDYKLEGANTLPLVMAKLKKEHAGTYDGKVASQLAKQIL